MRIKYHGTAGFTSGKYKFSLKDSIQEVDEKYAKYLLASFPTKFECLTEPEPPKEEAPKPTRRKVVRKTETK